ncbi:hypothetical protein [Kitasatospora sp. NPDC127060]|uniref:hypothetical protein n=1 Tax=Kitasatospora sp. NPDC127060 TaxID=3347121 RepID=UPI003660C4B6
MGSTLAFITLERAESALADQDPAADAVTICADGGCGAEIEPGPASRCGSTDDDSAVDGCGEHFCPEHLWLDGVVTPQPQHCEPCLDGRALRTAA